MRNSFPLATLLVLAMTSNAFAGAGGLASTHTVAIVSAIGWSAGMREQSDFTGAFEGESAYVDMAARGIDDSIERQIETLVSPRFQVVKVGIERAKVFSINPQYASDDYDQKLRSLMLAQQQAVVGVDAVIVVHSRYVTTGGALSGPWLSGLCVRKTKLMLGAISSSVAYAGYAVTVINPRTGEILGDGAATVGSGWLDRQIPMADVDADEWTSDPNGMSPSAKEKLEDTFEKLISESLPNALKQANLISETRNQNPTTVENAHP